MIMSPSLRCLKNATTWIPSSQNSPLHNPNVISKWLGRINSEQGIIVANFAMNSRKSYLNKISNPAFKEKSIGVSTSSSFHSPSSSPASRTTGTVAKKRFNLSSSLDTFQESTRNENSVVEQVKAKARLNSSKKRLETAIYSTPFNEKAVTTSQSSLTSPTPSSTSQTTGTVTRKRFTLSSGPVCQPKPSKIEGSFVEQVEQKRLARAKASDKKNSVSLSSHTEMASSTHHNKASPQAPVSLSRSTSAKEIISTRQTNPRRMPSSHKKAKIALENVPPATKNVSNPNNLLETTLIDTGTSNSALHDVPMNGTVLRVRAKRISAATLRQGPILLTPPESRENSLSSTSNYNSSDSAASSGMAGGRQRAPIRPSRMEIPTEASTFKVPKQWKRKTRNSVSASTSTSSGFGSEPEASPTASEKRVLKKRRTELRTKSQSLPDSDVLAKEVSVPAAESRYNLRPRSTFRPGKDAKTPQDATQSGSKSQKIPGKSQKIAESSSERRSSQCRKVKDVDLVDLEPRSRRKAEPKAKPDARREIDPKSAELQPIVVIEGLKETESTKKKAAKPRAATKDGKETTSVKVNTVKISKKHKEIAKKSTKKPKEPEKVAPPTFAGAPKTAKERQQLMLFLNQKEDQVKVPKASVLYQGSTEWTTVLNCRLDNSDTSSMRTPTTPTSSVQGTPSGSRCWESEEESRKDTPFLTRKINEKITKLKNVQQIHKSMKEREKQARKVEREEKRLAKLKEKKMKKQRDVVPKDKGEAEPRDGITAECSNADGYETEDDEELDFADKLRDISPPKVNQARCSTPLSRGKVKTVLFKERKAAVKAKDIEDCMTEEVRQIGEKVNKTKRKFRYQMEYNGIPFEVTAFAAHDEDSDEEDGLVLDSDEEIFV